MRITLWLLALSGYSITVHCRHLQTVVANPGGIGGIFKGPNSETIVKGPDGSVITSQETGGIIEQKLEPIIVAEPEILEENHPVSQELIENDRIIPLANSENDISSTGSLISLEGDHEYQIPCVVCSQTADSTYVPHPEPVIVPKISLEPPLEDGHLSSNIPAVPLPYNYEPPKEAEIRAIVNIVEPDPHIIETEIIDTPAVEPKGSTDLVGPSGRISTRGSESIVSGPASTTITKTAKVVIAPATVSGVLVAIPAHAPAFVETTNEIPQASHAPALLGPTGAVIQSTVSPLNLKLLKVPSAGHFQSTLSQSHGPVLTSLGSPVTLQPHIVPLESPNLIPATALDQPRQIFATGLLTGEQFEHVRSTLSPPLVPSRVLAPTPGPLTNHYAGKTLVPVSTPGVTVEDEGASGFVQPHLDSNAIHISTSIPVSSTIAPSYHQDFAHDNQQLIINPESILAHNIVPPEIGIPRGAINYGTTISSVGNGDGNPRAPGLFHAPRIQGIDNNIQRIENTDSDISIHRNSAILEHNIQNGYYHNDYIVGHTPDYVSNAQILSNNNHVQNPNIQQYGPIESV